MLLCLVCLFVLASFFLPSHLSFKKHNIPVSCIYILQSLAPCSLSYRSCCVSLMFSVLQVMLRVTPLREGELDVLGFIYNLCVEPGAPVKGSESPQTASCRANLPSLTISSKDSLYQRHKSSGVQHSLAEGVQVHACNCFIQRGRSPGISLSPPPPPPPPPPELIYIYTM